MKDDRVPEDALRQFAEAVLAKLGFTPDDATTAARVILEADLRGVDSHGIRGLADRAPHLASGRIVPAARPKLLKEQGTMALFDGQRGYGPLLCALVIPTAVALARQYGTGMVQLRNSSHWGCPAYYSRWIASQGCVGLGFTNTNPAMPLWGSDAKSIGNNPLTIAAPRRGHEPIVLDMAMQQISWGGLAIAHEEGKRLPGAWGFDTAGEPTDDPARIIESGRVRPVGDHKGSGLAFMLEIITGVLSGGSICHEIAEQTAAGNPAGYSQTFIAIRPDAFIDIDQYYDRVDYLYAAAKMSPIAAGFSEILLPGDRSNACFDDRQRNGIPITRIRAAVELLAQTLAVPLPWPVQGRGASASSA